MSVQHAAHTSLVNEKGGETCNAIKKVVFSDYSLCGGGGGGGMARCTDKHGIFEERAGVIIGYN